MSQRKTKPMSRQPHNDTEMDKRTNDLPESQHRGALAGLNTAEREEAIRRHVREQSQAQWDNHDYFRNRLEKDCLPGEPIFGLREILELQHSESFKTINATIENLETVLRSQGDTGSEKLQDMLTLKEELGKQENLEELVEESVSEFLDPAVLQKTINDLVKPQIERMRALTQEGGYRKCPEDPLPTPDEAPIPVEGLCYLFHADGAYHVVMPHEVVPLALELDWEQAFANERYIRRVAAFFECAADLRGMVEIGAALKEFVSNFDDGTHLEDDVYKTLLDNMEDEQVISTLLKTDKGTYLLHPELFAMYQRRRGEEPYIDSCVVEGPATELIRGMLEMQRGMDPYPITEEMLTAGSGFEWKLEQPPAIAMRSYLDEHVPDNENDYYFADNVMEELLTGQAFGVTKGSVGAFFETLEDFDFIPDESQVQPLLNLWQNLCNGLPVWSNNGWPPNELAQQRVGGRRTGMRPVYHNPDGSVRKIGRNDPCPCGSGKKYKRCCGR